MTDSADDTGLPSDVDSAEAVDPAETADSIADEIRGEILLGHIQDDVSHVLEERLEEEGIDMRPEDVDELAEEIEKDASS
ncbi:hypothetical protein ACLH0K_15370 [Arthrobacter sp. MPF02]|uniref:hypothetical protein n=1 Tax=Arthrobacter sp. MPF02 TaxID=3388492 RepID=UPI003984CDDE